MAKKQTDVDVRQRAVNYFSIASGLLLSYPFPDKKAIAGALLNAAAGMTMIAKLDHDLAALGMAEDVVTRLRKDATDGE